MILVTGIPRCYAAEMRQYQLPGGGWEGRSPDWDLQVRLERQEEGTPARWQTRTAAQGEKVLHLANNYQWLKRKPQ